METSVAVPTRAELVEAGLGELSDQELDELADTMASVWRSQERARAMGVLLPLGGAVGFTLVGGALGSGVAALAVLGVLSGGLAAALAHLLLGRSLAFEVERLGYDRAVVGAVVHSAPRAVQSALRALTRKQKLKACRDALRQAREHALPSRSS
jgi:hypothetical protein